MAYRMIRIRWRLEYAKGARLDQRRARKVISVENPNGEFKTRELDRTDYKATSSNL